MSDITVLVLDADAKTGPTTVRTLGRTGMRVLVCAPPGPVAPAQRSRYRAARLTHPHAIDDPDGLLEWLDKTIDAHRPDCVLPMTEYTIRVLDRARDMFEGRTALALPPSEALGVAFDKERLLELAESLGLDIPVTWRPNTVDEAMDLAAELTYPVYVKARESYSHTAEHARFARGRFAHTPEDFRRLYAELDDRSPSPIVQDAVPGYLVAVSGVWQRGRCVCLFSYISHRSWPISGGYGAFRESVAPDAAPIAETARLMEALDWSGPAHTQFIIDSRDGRARLMETNGRFWGSVEFGHYCGSPIAETTVRVALDESVEPHMGYRVGALSRWLEADLKRLYAVLFRRRKLMREALVVPGRLRTLADLFGGFRPGIHQDDLYLDDPVPPLALMARSLNRELRSADPGGPSR
jgi:predicted ATP-grasp superfamily ATP-dependent carboligase